MSDVWSLMFEWDNIDLDLRNGIDDNIDKVQ